MLLEDISGRPKSTEGGSRMGQARTAGSIFICDISFVINICTTQSFSLNCIFKTNLGLTSCHCVQTGTGHR